MNLVKSSNSELILTPRRPVGGDLSGDGAVFTTSPYDMTNDEDDITSAFVHTKPLEKQTPAFPTVGSHKPLVCQDVAGSGCPGRQGSVSDQVK